jgi:CxxC motif-containing protein (DUF1111 family)
MFRALRLAKNGTILMGALALASCTGETMRPGSTPTGNPSNAGSAGTGGGDTSGLAGTGGDPTLPSGTAGVGSLPTTGGAGTGADPYVPPDNPPVLPSTACGALPGSFATICAGCHTASGESNSRYPDLFKFAGDAAALKTKVRAGGGGMAAYPASLIADADLDAIYAYFKGKTRPALESTGLGSVVPLFSKTDAVNPPVVFKRDDGALITRGAGRVRGRHEGPQNTNMPFMEWIVNYFSDRTYGWIVEDYTTAGQSKIVASYLPIGPATGGTNFRAWKNYNNGDVFAINGILAGNAPMPNLMMAGTDMAANYQTKFAPYYQVQSGTTTGNMRTGGAIKAGDLFEFEFGIFFQGSIKPAGSRTAYYTDTFRYNVGKGGITSNNPDSYGGAGTLGPVLEAQSGGDTTNVWPYYMKETQFGQMALNVQHENVQNLVEGRRLFHTNFADGSHSEQGNGIFTEQVGKAGPLGQQKACEGCHMNNGPGETIKTALDGSTMAIKLYNSTLGAQLQPSQGSAQVMGTTTKTVMVDGQAVTLTKPTIAVMAKDGTTPAFSARIARKVIGMGLLEAIDERTILARADQGDCDGNGISGRPNFVKDPVNGMTRLGRFGWKAEKVSVAHQSAEAAFLDMGVGSSLFPDAGKTELTDADLAKLTTYMRLVSVPGQRNYGDAAVTRGEQIFKTIGCANCHATDIVTGPNHPFAELRNQAIKPYSDMLLHDMGPDLADNSGIAAPGTNAAAPAGASEWRTPPLWGTGLLSTISTHTGLLHDGRAKDVLEAVLWHGGEAELVKTAVTKLTAADRNALIAFVNSL